MHTVIASLMVLLIGIMAVFTATDGLRAFTAEGARRLRVMERPVAIPNATLIDIEGKSVPLASLQGKVVLVEFIYTTCPTICQEMGSASFQVMEAVRTRGLTEDVRLLSLSFDLDDDMPRDLKAYGERHNADERIWRIMKPATPRDLKRLLELFGVTVIPDPIFKYQHNAAVHVISRDGRLVRIVDIAAQEAISAMLAEVVRP